MRHDRKILGVGFAVLLCAGCGDDGESAPSADAQLPVDAELPVDADLPADAFQCNDLVVTGPEVVETYVAEDPPIPVGGSTIPDGTYHLVEQRVYTGTAGATGPTGNVFRGTIQLTELVMEGIEENNVGWEVPHRHTSVLVIDGANLTQSYTCGLDWEDRQIQFDTEPGKVTFYLPRGEDTWGVVFELEP